MSLSRRELLKRVGSAGLILGGAGILCKVAWEPGSAAIHGGEKPTTRDYRVDGQRGNANELASLAVAKGDPLKNDIDPATLVGRAIAGLGGMKRFISRGDKVVVKPNIGWDRTPLHAANTNPKVVAEVVRQAYDAGASNVVVTDASCNEPSRCFSQSGIWDAAYAVGAEVVLPAEHRFRAMRIKGELLDEWPVYTALVEADKVINVPVAKHHNLAKYTGAMKNWYGALGGRRNRLHQKIDISVADLATFMQPTLTIIDGTRVLMRNGPQGGNIADAKDMFTVIASTDQIAADAYACQLIGQTSDEISYIKLGHDRGLGTMDWESLNPVFV